MNNFVQLTFQMSTSYFDTALTLRHQMMRAITVLELGKARTLDGACRMTVIPEQRFDTFVHWFPVEATLSLLNGHRLYTGRIGHFHNAHHQLLYRSEYYGYLNVTVNGVRYVQGRVNVNGDILVGSERQFSRSHYAIGD